MTFFAAFVLTSAGLALAAPDARSPAASTATLSKAGATEQTLLCARIWLVTSSAHEPDAHVSLEKLGAEGGAADVYVDGDLLRIDGQILGESTRERVDYRFRGGELVCAEEMHTNILTVLGGDKPGAPQRPPWFWRTDFRVYSHGELVHSTTDEAAGPNEPHREVGETLAFSKQLLALAQKALAEKAVTKPPKR